MSTRCQIAFSNGTESRTVYRHWDGYPSAVIPDEWLDRALYPVKTLLQPGDLLDQGFHLFPFEGDAAVPTLAQPLAHEKERFFRQGLRRFVTQRAEHGHQVLSATRIKPWGDTLIIPKKCARRSC